MQTPGFGICICAIMGYMNIIDIDLFKNELVLILVKHPRFSSLLIERDKRLSMYSWKQTKVDIEKHVSAPDLDPDMESPDEFVEKSINRIFRKIS
ncbi:hypothetical protein ABFS82_06G148700 [Erythranthe guttata]